MDWRSTNFYIFDGKGSTQTLAQTRKYFAGFLDAFEDAGVNTVSLTWFNPVSPKTGTIRDTYGNRMPDYFRSLPTNKLLKTLTADAQARGFDVMWKPHFVLNNAKAGNVNANFAPDGFDVGAFLANVKTYWADLAPVAEAANVDLLILGTEHGEYAGPAYDAEWRDIIQTVRAAYSGEITYDALGYVSRPVPGPDDITFWDALDYIGISLYLPLATDDTPTLEEALV